MKKSGNGEALRCAENLTAIVRGEIPFDRVRGIDARIVDRPAETAAQDLEQEVIWNIDTYEPRIDADSTTVEAVIDDDGSFSIEIQVSDAVDDEEE